MKGKKIIFFDLDGTLTDSKEGIFNSIRYALSFFGIEENDDEKLKVHLGPAFSDSFKEHFNLSDEETDLAIEKYREVFSVSGIKQLTVYDGIEKMLKKLKKAGKTLCLATAKPLKYAEEIMNDTGLFKYFDYLSGATMDESRNNKEKVIKYAIDNNNYDREKIIMVGDRNHDIIGAKENNIEAVGVLYGYGSFDELKNAGCKHFVKTVSDLEKFLLE